MEFKILKTFELSDNDWKQIVDGFNESFQRNTTKEKLLNLYQFNIFGYSLHTVCFDNEKIYYFSTIMPLTYLHNNLQEFKTGLSCSTFMLKEYRKDFLSLLDVIEEVHKEYVKQGYSVILGVPNKNMHKTGNYFFGAKDAGYLPYFSLPLRFFNVLKKKKLSFLNPIFAFFASTFCLICKLLSYIFNFKEDKAEYRLLINEDFHKNRFSAPHYQFSQKKNIKFWYRIVEEDGIKTAYLMDFREKEIRTNKALCTAVWKILRKEKTDIIMFVGTLRVKQFLLFKIPEKYVPKPLPLTYNIINSEMKEQFKTMSNLKNWDFSLMNFDAR